jgi:hypothetical protein
VYHPTLSLTFHAFCHQTQYGFIMVGRWSVDHSTPTTANLRERSDSYNMSFQPRASVKDFRHGRGFNFDDTTKSCTCFNTTGSQPRWELPADASRLGSANATDRWRVFHSTQGICVDFFVPAGAAPQAVPSEIRYLGQCSSATKVGPGEVLAQRNVYSNVSFAQLPDTLFALPADCEKRNCSLVLASASAPLALAPIDTPAAAIAVGSLSGGILI